MSRFTLVTGPEHWSVYLVNGDASAMTAHERAKADAWLKRVNTRVIGVFDDSERFTWSYRLYAPECDCDGGSVVDYICETQR